MLLTDLQELKKTLEIHPENTQEDAKLWLFVEWATGLIEESLGIQPGRLSLKERTEFYGGTGTQMLLLRSRPVILDSASAPTNLTVLVDEGGFFGSKSGSFAQPALTWGGDYCLDIDQDDGLSSRSAILFRINGYWPRPTHRQVGLLTPFVGTSLGNVKVTYNGGHTVDMLPSSFRAAVNMQVAAMRYMFPLGMALTSESYEERNISLSQPQKDYLMGMVKPLLSAYRNWKW